MVFEDVMVLVATCKFHLIQSMYTNINIWMSRFI